MYFANMFCYGRDATAIGVTGILGCLAVIYAGDAGMYATHIVCGSAEDDATGRKTFTDWVKQQEQHLGNGHLFLLTNGGNRPQTAEEALEMKKALKKPTTTVYKITKNLTANVGNGGNASIVILMERAHGNDSNPSGCSLYYKKNEDVVWVDGGSAESGQYKVRPDYTGAKVPNDLNFGWRTVLAGNAEVTTI